MPNFVVGNGAIFKPHRMWVTTKAFAQTARHMYLHVFRTAVRLRWSIAILQELDEWLPGLYLYAGIGVAS